MRPHGQRMGANDCDGTDRPVAVVVKARARREDDDACEAEDYDWLDKPMAGVREEPVRMSGRPCACGGPRRLRAHRCDACREVARLTALRPTRRRSQWRRLSPVLSIRTCTCGIVFAERYEESRCSICRAPEWERSGRRARARHCACGAMFAAKGTQTWCDGCRLKARKPNEGG